MKPNGETIDCPEYGGGWTRFFEETDEEGNLVSEWWRSGVRNDMYYVILHERLRKSELSRVYLAAHGADGGVGRTLTHKELKEDEVQDYVEYLMENAEKIAVTEAL